MKRLINYIGNIGYTGLEIIEIKDFLKERPKGSVEDIGLLLKAFSHIHSFVDSVGDLKKIHTPLEGIQYYWYSTKFLLLRGLDYIPNWIQYFSNNQENTMLTAIKKYCEKNGAAALLEKIKNGKVENNLYKFYERNSQQNILWYLIVWVHQTATLLIVGKLFYNTVLMKSKDLYQNWNSKTNQMKFESIIKIISKITLSANILSKFKKSILSIGEIVKKPYDNYKNDTTSAQPIPGIMRVILILGTLRNVFKYLKDSILPTTALMVSPDTIDNSLISKLFTFEELKQAFKKDRKGHLPEIAIEKAKQRSIMGVVNTGLTCFHLVRLGQKLMDVADASPWKNAKQVISFK